MKNIVNPNPQIYNQGGVPELNVPQRVQDEASWSLNGQPLPSNYGRTSGRRFGQPLEWYKDKRNRFVIDAIHTVWLSGVGFLNVGESVGPSSPSYGLTNTNNRVTMEDALAYAALYPQNAWVVRSPAVPPNPRNPRINGYSFGLARPAKDKRQAALDRIATVVADAGANSALNTVTTAAAQKPANQTTAAATSQAFAKVGGKLPRQKGKWEVSKDSIINL